MKLPDLLTLRNQEPKTYLQFAASQTQGTQAHQEDYFLNFNDECFVTTDGASSMLHGDIAAKLSADTALWAYKLVRQRPHYWSEKKEFISRIFRSTNLTIWKKRQLTGFEDIAISMDVLMVHGRSYWFGHVGVGSIFLFSAGTLIKLTDDHINKNGELTKFLGMRRLGLAPQVASGKFNPGDMILMVTNGVTRALAPEMIQTLMATMDFTGQAPVDLVSAILQKANKLDGSGNMTASLIRRIR